MKWWNRKAVKPREKRNPAKIVYRFLPCFWVVPPLPAQDAVEVALDGTSQEGRKGLDAHFRHSLSSGLQPFEGMTKHEQY
jgi:hypothetical protein